MDRKRAFTLIELLVVIAIIAVLMGILMPSLRAAKEQAKRTRCAANLRDIGRALVMYGDTYDQKLPPGSFRGAQGQNPWQSYTAYGVDTSKPWGQHITGGPSNLAYLHAAKLCADGEIFYCPSARHVLDMGGPGIAFQRYESYSDEGHPWPWNTIGEGIVRMGYMYFPQSKFKEDVQGWKLPKYTNSLSKLSVQHTVVTELLHIRRLLPHTTGGRTGRAKGVYGLFGDGHVNFSTNQEAFVDDLWAESPGNNPVGFRMIVSKLDP